MERNGKPMNFGTGAQWNYVDYERLEVRVNKAEKGRAAPSMNELQMNGARRLMETSVNQQALAGILPIACTSS